MVKPDAKRNYYADLEISPSADVEEIKKQFRKLARLYHPDRNPGKELEYVPKFQAIQAAHEILSDPEARAKYDAERRTLAGQRPMPPPRAAGAGPQADPNWRSPYEKYSNFPPPRMRTHAGQNPPRPSSYAAYPPASSARTPSYANAPPRRGAHPTQQQTRPPPPPPPPPPRQTNAKDDSDARRKMYSAWERTGPNQRPPEQTWSDDDGLRRARAAQDAANAHTSRPGLGRSNTARGVPRQAGGFNPFRMSGDEPQARSTSSYQAHTHTAPATPPMQAKSHDSTPQPRPDPFHHFRRASGGEDAPYAEGTRVRTPYTSQGVGQKTYFNTEGLSRSSSMRDALKTEGEAARKGPSPREGAGRPRSASPAARGTNGMNTSGRRASANHHGHSTHGAAFTVDGQSSSESSADEPSTSSHEFSRGTTGGATGLKPRQTARPGKSWSQRTRHPTAGTQTAPDSPLNGGTQQPPMYDNNLSFQPSPSYNKATYQGTASGRQAEIVHSAAVRLEERNMAGRRRTTLNESTASFTATNSASEPAARNVNKQTANAQVEQSEHMSITGHNPKQQHHTSQYSSDFPQYALNPRDLTNFRARSFSFTNVDGSGYSARNSSSDNINTKFTSHEWDGAFQGSQKFSHQAASPAQRNDGASRNESSKEIPINLDSSHPGSQSNPINLDGIRIPPPPPNPPASTATTNGGPSDDREPVKFSKEQWEETIKSQSFFYPNDDTSRSASPSKSSVTFKKPKIPKSRKQSKSEDKSTSGPYPFSSDASDEESEVPLSKAKTVPNTTMEGDAMDIDSESPLGASKSASPNAKRGPRMVNVPPHRPEWQHRSSIPTPPEEASGGKPPMSKKVPQNVTLPPPPPGPPPSDGPPISNTKQKRDASLNLDSFRSAAPFAPSGDGLSDLHDLSGTLPFQSQASEHASKVFAPRALALPSPPKAPIPPRGNQIYQNMWRQYMAQMAFYQGQWYRFNAKMLSHFQARHANSARFGTGEGQASSEAMRLLEAGGEASGEDSCGYMTYLTGMDEDVRVQRHWDAAREKHKYAIEQLLAFKRSVYEGKVPLLPDVKAAA